MLQTWSRLGNPEPGGGERKITSVQKVVNMYVLGCLGGTSYANDADYIVHHQHHKVLSRLFRLSID